jgi:outer membrane protein OmpA-like peptidoglycan-associated protein
MVNGVSRNVLIGQRMIALCLAAGWLSLAGCVQTQWAPPSRTADQTMDLEVADRVNRLDRLARVQGVVPPDVEQLAVPREKIPGATRPIPVIRVTFVENDFFAPGGASPQPAATHVLQIMAENIRHDVPDVRVTVLGHTDGIGSDAGNQALSRRRATSVVSALVAAGVNPGQLDAVAIGSAQPIGSNNTAGGRARNRRVEFLISANGQANLTAVSMRQVNSGFLALGAGTHRQVAVLKPHFSGPADVSEAPAGGAREENLSLSQSGPPLNVGDDVTGSPVVAGRDTPETGSPVAATAASFRPLR